jgi:O-antigen/teichoic acid export membrane protein
VNSLLIFYQLDFRSSERVYAFSISELTRPLVFVICILFGNYFFEVSSISIYSAWILSTIIALLICFFLGTSFESSKQQGDSLDFDELKGSYLLGLNTGFHYLSGYLLPFLDKFSIKALYTTSALSIYAAGYTMGQISTLIVDLLVKVYTPSILRRMNTDKTYYEWYLKNSPRYALMMILILSPITAGIVYLAATYLLPASYESSLLVGVITSQAFLVQILYQSQFLLLYHNNLVESLGRISFFSTLISGVYLFFAVNYFYTYVGLVYGLHYITQSILIRYKVRKIAS